MTLPEFIDYKTVRVIAEVLNLDLSTVYRWKNFQTIPEPVTAAFLIKMSRGLLSYSDIYSPFFERHKESRERQRQMDPDQLQLPNI